VGIVVIHKSFLTRTGEVQLEESAGVPFHQQIVDGRSELVVVDFDLVLAYPVLLAASSTDDITNLVLCIYILEGMQVTAEIHLGTRSVFEYLLSPIQKTAHQAWRER